MILQLNPTIPVYVINKGNGHAFILIDYSQEHPLIFVIAMDDTGEIWALPQQDIRLQFNITLDRIRKETK